MITSLTATPSEVDTLSGPAAITIQVRETDVEAVTSVGAVPSARTNDSTSPTLHVGGLMRMSGTQQNGIWQAQLLLPQGTPPDTYTFQAWVEDVSHWRSYVSANSPHADSPNPQLLPGDAKVVVRPAP